MNQNCGKGFPHAAQTTDKRISIPDNFGEDRLLLQWLPLGVSADPSVNMQLPNYNLHVTWANITSKVWCLNCTFGKWLRAELALLTRQTRRSPRVLETEATHKI